MEWILLLLFITTLRLELTNRSSRCWYFFTLLCSSDSKWFAWPRVKHKNPIGQHNKARLQSINMRLASYACSSLKPATDFDLHSPALLRRQLRISPGDLRLGVHAASSSLSASRRTPNWPPHNRSSLDHFFRSALISETRRKWLCRIGTDLLSRLK